MRECWRRPRGGALGAGTVEREERVTRVEREERNFSRLEEIFLKTQVLLVYVRESKAARRSRQRLVERLFELRAT